MPSRLKAAELAKLEDLIRAARFPEARARLRDLRRLRVSRQLKPVMANLAWRAGIPEMGVSLLHPLVRPDRAAVVATVAEKVEYAQSLRRIGAIREALQLFEEVRDDPMPEIRLYMASSRFAIWDYQGSLRPLQEYVHLAKDSYQQLIGRVNLAAAQIFERQLVEGEKTLELATMDAQALNARALLGNCLELRAQLSLEEGRYADAELALNRAAALVDVMGSIYGLFVEKWKAILALKSGKRERGLEALARVRGEAVKRQHWETVRSCDHYRAIAMRDSMLFRHVYFGSPFESYRLKLLREWPGSQEVPPEFAWQLGARPSPLALDVSLGQDSSGRRALAPGGLPHRLLHALSTDFYRPFRPVTLFEMLFPKEHFNPQSALPRVHLTIRRLRMWLRDNGFPLTVKELDGSYRLEARRPVALRVRIGDPLSGEFPAEEALLRRLREAHLDPNGFKARQAAWALRISRRQAQRLLRWALDHDRLESKDRSQGILYKFRD